jgi:hypothetical protein
MLMARAYEDRKVYGCLILNRLASELDLCVNWMKGEQD